MLPKTAMHSEHDQCTKCIIILQWYTMASFQATPDKGKHAGKETDIGEIKMKWELLFIHYHYFAGRCNTCGHGSISQPGWSPQRMHSATAVMNLAENLDKIMAWFRRYSSFILHWISFKFAEIMRKILSLTLMLSILSNPGEKQRYSNLNPGDDPRTGASVYNTLHQADAVNHVYGGGARVNGLIRLPAAAPFLFTADRWLFIELQQLFKCYLIYQINKQW